MTAVTDRAAAAAAYRAALGRKREHRANDYRSYGEAERRQAWLEDRELPRVSVFAAEFRPAETMGEWLDDRVIEWGKMPGPEAPLMVALAEAARDGAAAAAAVLGAARGLGPAVQWAVYQNLRIWRTLDGTGRFGADRLALALQAEWERLGLPAEDPALTEKPARRRRPWEITETEAAS